MNKPIMATIAALALLGAGTALAHPAAPGSAGSAKAGWHAMHQDRMAARLATLKSQLQIAATQESAWSGFATAIQGMMHPAKSPQMMAKQSGALTPAPDVFNAMAKMAAARAQNAQALARAVNALYQKLSPVQRAVLNTHLADMHARMHHRHKHGGHMRPRM